MTSRGVWQLRKLTIHYCDKAGSSRGVRDYLGKMLVPFAQANPQLEVVARHRPSKHPFVQGEYVTEGEQKQLSLKNLSALQVATQVQSLRDSRPVNLRKWAKPFRSSPSVQGPWEQGRDLGPHRTIRTS